MEVFVRAKICSDPCKRGLSVQLWDLKKEGKLLNTRTVHATLCSSSAVNAWSLVIFCLVS